MNGTIYNTITQDLFNPKLKPTLFAFFKFIDSFNSSYVSILEFSVSVWSVLYNHVFAVHGGARPKTVHLAVRQQSVTSPSSSALTVMNLKQNQVDILKAEIESTGGLVKIVSKVHFQQGLALVECFGKIW